NDSVGEVIPGGIVDPGAKRRKVILDDHSQTALDFGDGQGAAQLVVPDVANDRIPKTPDSASVEVLPEIAAGLENVIREDLPIAVVDFAPLREGHDQMRNAHAPEHEPQGVRYIGEERRGLE